MNFLPTKISKHNSIADSVIAVAAFTVGLDELDGSIGALTFGLVMGLLGGYFTYRAYLQWPKRSRCDVVSINKDWIDELPPFVSISRVAELFDQSSLTVRRWARDDRYPLKSIKLDNGQRVCPRDTVAATAQKLYGELEESDDASPGAGRESGTVGRSSRDGMD